MCRYAWHHYKDHFACFECRKAFKHRQWEPLDAGTWKMRRRLQHAPREVACPDCARPMVDMGLDFKSPPKEDREAWRILEILHEHGFTFHGCGCSVGFTPPRRLREVPSWLESHKRSSEGESLANRFAAKTTDPRSPPPAK